MKRIARPLLLFVCSFAIGIFIAPVFEVDVEEEPVSEPTEERIHHYRNKYGERIKRIA